MAEEENEEIHIARQYLNAKLGGRYEVGQPLGMGGAGVVFKVHDIASGIPRVAKVLRPSVRELPADQMAVLANDFQGEATKLGGLRHQHLVAVFEQSIDATDLPYFIMEFLPGETLDKAIPELVHRQQRGAWIDFVHRIFVQLADVLAYLHSKHLFHLDVKPENIILAKDYRGTPLALLLDFGLSRFESTNDRGTGHTTAMGTFNMWPRKYVEECLQKMTTPGRTVFKIRRDHLNGGLDLHLLGRTMDLVLQAGLEKDSVPVAEWPAPAQLQLRFMHDLTANLDIDGDAPRYFPAASDVRDALGRLELRASRVRERFGFGTVKLPGPTISSFGAAAKKLTDWHRFQRLRGIHQLGLAYLVYPGAVHTRLEHSLGAFENALAVLDRLSGPQGDYRFRAMVSDEDLVATAIVTLWHDIGHYPFAHQLRIKGNFPKHEERTLKALKSKEAQGIIRGEFGDTVCQAAGAIMKNVIAYEDTTVRHSPQPPDPPHYHVLRQIVSGTVDVDKLDYVSRDAIHCGVPYGTIVDRDRLLASLRIWWGDDGIPHLLLSDKGRVCAEALVFARYVMFSEVYWNHGVRAFAAMLSAAIDQIEPAVIRPHLWDTDAVFLEWLTSLDVCRWLGELVRSRRPYRRAFVHQRLGGADGSIEEDDRLFRLLEEAVGDTKKLVRVREVVAKALKITAWNDHEIVLDVPRMSRVGGIKVLPEGREEPGGVGPIFDAVNRNFDGYARKARIFVHPAIVRRKSVLESTKAVRLGLRKEFHI